MPTFPRAEWMTAYADTVAAHPRADAMSTALAGRFRFVVKAGGGLETRLVHDMVVAPGGVFVAEPGDESMPATLTVTADYPRWKGLITGKADFVMSFLMRKVKVQGDLSTVRDQLSDARPLLECLHSVPTEFEF